MPLSDYVLNRALHESTPIQLQPEHIPALTEQYEVTVQQIGYQGMALGVLAWFSPNTPLPRYPCLMIRWLST